MSIRGPTCLVWSRLPSGSLCSVSGHVCTATLQHDLDKLSTQDDQTAWLPSCFAEIRDEISVSTYQLVQTSCVPVRKAHTSTVLQSSLRVMILQRAASKIPTTVQHLHTCCAGFAQVHWIKSWGNCTSLHNYTVRTE